MTLPLRMLFGIIASQGGGAPPPQKNGFYSGSYIGNSGGQTISCPGVDLLNSPGFISIKASDASFNWCQTVTEDGPYVQYGSSTTGISKNNISVTAFHDGSFDTGTDGRVNSPSDEHLFWAMSGSGLFCAVEYTGNGGTQQIPIDLEYEPTMIWVKENTGSANWAVYNPVGGPGVHMILNSTAAEEVGNCWDTTAPTKTTLTVGPNDMVNGSGKTYMAMVFCWNPGHCVGTGYAGTGSPLEVDFGFDPDLIIVKCRTLNISWVVFSTALGINPPGGNDPFFMLDLANAQESGMDWIYPVSGGIGINGGNNINLSGEDYYIIAWKNGAI